MWPVPVKDFLDRKRFLSDVASVINLWKQHWPAGEPRKIYQEILAAEEAVDELVYALYGISNKERQKIENKLF